MKRDLELVKSITANYHEKLKNGLLSAKEQRHFWQLLHPKRGRPKHQLKIGFIQYVTLADELVNTHSEKGTKSPVKAAFVDMAEALTVEKGYPVNVDTARRYYRFGVEEFRESERRTAAEIDVLTRQLKMTGVKQPHLAALKQYASYLGQTMVIMQRRYDRGSKSGGK
jgi:hypothetical protein